MSYIEMLIESCNKAKNAEPIKEFILSDISQLNGINKAIYIIEDMSNDNAATFRQLSDYKATKQRACPKLNTASSVMYVGSSTSGVKKRIEQHLGIKSSKDTYALHLSHWFKGETKITIKIYDESVENEVLQIIEDALSHELKPAFGKQGGNNK